jgi:hypothetical protein
MGSATSRRYVRLAVVLCALVAGGCGGQSETSTAAATSSTSTTAAATTRSATTLTAGPMTGEELVWLEAISKLHREIDKVLANSPTNMTSGTLRTLANDLRGCGRELARLGVPSDRLEPVYILAKRGCAQYDKGAQCLATAADVPAPIPGTAAERKFKQALDCGFKTPGEGSLLLAEAEGKGFEIKAAAG